MKWPMKRPMKVPNWLFNWPKSVDIMSRDEKELYLTRWWLLGTDSSKYALMLHKMHQPDPDECHHDHPWPFITMILKGGYKEDIQTEPGQAFTRHNKPGMVLYRPAIHAHRISDLPKGTAWTLVLRGPLERRWGFHTEDGWMHNRKFLDGRIVGGVAWCAGWIRNVVRGSRSDV